MSPLIPDEGSTSYVIKVSNLQNFLCGLLLDLFFFLTFLKNVNVKSFLWNFLSVSLHEKSLCCFILCLFSNTFFLQKSQEKESTGDFDSQIFAF